jgi:RNA polymerase sigma factor (TIGR02999 family)
VTQLLATTAGGDFNQLVTAVYDDLRRIAAGKKAEVFKARNVTIQTTEVVHQAVIELMRQRETFESRGEFFGVASMITLRVLLDDARRRMSKKRGSGERGDSLSDDLTVASGRGPNNLPIEYAELFQRLMAHDPRSAEVFSLCTFAGYTQPQAGAELGITPKQAEHDMAYARQWWKRELERADRPPAM